MFSFLKKKFSSHKRQSPEILQTELLIIKENVILPAKIEALNQSDLYSFQQLLIDIRLANQQLQKIEKLNTIFNAKSFRDYSERDRYAVEKFMERSKFLRKEAQFYPRKIEELSSLKFFALYVGSMERFSKMVVQQKLIDLLQGSSYFELEEYTQISMPSHVVVNQKGRMKVLRCFFKMAR